MSNLCNTLIEIESHVHTTELIQHIFKYGFLWNDKRYDCPFIEDEGRTVKQKMCGERKVHTAHGFTKWNLTAFGKANGGEYGDYEQALHNYLKQYDPDVVTIIKEDEDCEDFVSVEVLYKDKRYQKVESYPEEFDDDDFIEAEMEIDDYPLHERVDDIQHEMVSEIKKILEIK